MSHSGMNPILGANESCRLCVKIPLFIVPRSDKLSEIQNALLTFTNKHSTATLFAIDYSQACPSGIPCCHDQGFCIYIVVKSGKYNLSRTLIHSCQHLQYGRGCQTECMPVNTVGNNRNQQMGWNDQGWRRLFPLHSINKGRPGHNDNTSIFWSQVASIHNHIPQYAENGPKKIISKNDQWVIHEKCFHKTGNTPCLCGESHVPSRYGDLYMIQSLRQAESRRAESGAEFGSLIQSSSVSSTASGDAQSSSSAGSSKRLRYVEEEEQAPPTNETHPESSSSSSRNIGSDKNLQLEIMQTLRVAGKQMGANLDELGDDPRSVEKLLEETLKGTYMQTFGESIAISSNAACFPTKIVLEFASDSDFRLAAIFFWTLRVADDPSLHNRIPTEASSNEALFRFIEDACFPLPKRKDGSLMTLGDISIIFEPGLATEFEVECCNAENLPVWTSGFDTAEDAKDALSRIPRQVREATTAWNNALSFEELFFSNKEVNEDNSILHVMEPSLQRTKVTIRIRSKAFRGEFLIPFPRESPVDLSTYLRILLTTANPGKRPVVVLDPFSHLLWIAVDVLSLGGSREILKGIGESIRADVVGNKALNVLPGKIFDGQAWLTHNFHSAFIDVLGDFRNRSRESAAQIHSALLSKLSRFSTEVEQRRKSQTRLVAENVIENAVCYLLSDHAYIDAASTSQNVYRKLVEARRNAFKDAINDVASQLLKDDIPDVNQDALLLVAAATSFNENLSSHMLANMPDEADRDRLKAILNQTIHLIRPNDARRLNVLLAGVRQERNLEDLLTELGVPFDVNDAEILASRRETIKLLYKLARRFWG